MDLPGTPEPTRGSKIVCLCGSTSLKKTFEVENERLTLDGYIVLSCGVFAGAAAHGEITAEQKALLDRLHLEKIMLSDEVLVLNVDGYVGESTRKEVEFALNFGVPVRFLEDGRPGTLSECLLCSHTGYVPFTGPRAVGEFGEMGWRSVPSEGWVCPSCASENGEAGEGVLGGAAQNPEGGA